jgi:hypothetical protein
MARNQPLTWPFLIALVEQLWWLEETATHGNQLERKHGSLLFPCILMLILNFS